MASGTVTAPAMPGSTAVPGAPVTANDGGPGTVVGAPVSPNSPPMGGTPPGPVSGAPAPAVGVPPLDQATTLDPPPTASGQPTSQPAPGAQNPSTAPGTEAAPPVPLPKAVYTFDGDPATVDHAEWPDASQKTGDGAPLFYFSGDTAPGDAKGDGAGGGWHHYSGPTVPAGGTTAAATPTAS